MLNVTVSTRNVHRKVRRLILEYDLAHMLFLRLQGRMKTWIQR